jgi:hypothetical protein
MTGATVRLAAVLGCIALATSRLGLVAHELGGHGGMALLLGGVVTQVKLFWFAGGWIRYRLDAGEAGLLAVTVAGMAVEVVLGGILWLAVRGRTLGARLVRGAGAALVIHATWYFATGAWHGYGDGTLLYRDLGDARWPAAIAVAAVGCAMAYAVARWLAGAVAATVASRGRVVAAVALALGCNAALFVGERVVRSDAVYADTMRREDERVVERELRAWQAREVAAGAAVDDRAVAVEQQRLEDDNRQFPFRWVFAAALVAALAAGVRRSPREPAGDIPPQLVIRSAAVAAAATALVIALAVALG